jgi:hypothetical protein
LAIQFAITAVISLFELSGDSSKVITAVLFSEAFGFMHGYWLGKKN